MSDQKEVKLGMLIDLSVCIGCNACAVACKMENDVPLTCFNTWIETWDTQNEETGKVTRANLPKLCNHCDNPSCVSVCPTGASYVAEDGTVQVDKSRCIGCKYCMAACSYGVRYWDHLTGEVDKCSFCHHRTQYGMLPACVGTCVTKARIFGDLNDPESDISKKLESAESSDVLLEGMNMAPVVHYVGLKETMKGKRVSSLQKGGNTLVPLEEGGN